MDLSHQTQLPIIARLLDDRFNIARSWIEAKAGSAAYGETADVFSVVERGGYWPLECVVGGKYEYRNGQTVVSEYKSSVSDLRADQNKKWRSPNFTSLGDWRYYWLRKDGDVRPEHVDEENRWGVIMFDDHDCEMVRLCRPLHGGVNVWAQTALIVRLMSKEAYQGKDAPSSSRRPKTRHAASKDVDKAVELIKQGPMSYAQIRRELGLKGTALLRDLERDNRIQQDGPGGNFHIKDDAA